MQRIVFILFVISFALAYQGVDFSHHQGSVSENTLRCFRTSGFQDFLIVLASRSNGQLNPYLGDVLQRAKNAGYTKIDVYIFPNTNLNPKTQVANVVNFLKSRGLDTAIGTIWIDVEQEQYWKTCEFNKNFVKEMVNAVISFGKKAGIYSNARYWKPIMCSTTEFKHLPLWYAHWNNKASFDGFTEFGGWNLSNNKPVMKQYAGDVTVCNTNVDKNWRPAL